jgi:hypothetical protein
MAQGILVNDLITLTDEIHSRRKLACIDVLLQ